MQAGAAKPASVASPPSVSGSAIPIAPSSAPSSAPSFDLSSYISNYTSFTRVFRLVNIAEWCPQLRSEALKLALTELKSGMNTQLYAQACKLAGASLGPAFALDQKWVEDTDKRAQSMQERLELDLNNYKVNVVRESIRNCHNELGDFFIRRGDFTNALKSFIRARDYSSSPKHEMTLCLNVIKVSIAMGNYSYLQSYLAKAESTPPEGPESERRILNSKLKVASGLNQLFNRSYRQAARSFLECNIEIGNSFSEVISPSDIALFGGICALATYDRRELKAKVIDNGTFKSFLELQPDLREAINHFHQCNYAECLGLLERLRPDLMLDIYLREHVPALLASIREKALIQYFRSYVTVDLNRMAPAFNTNVADLEAELAALIMDGKIQARIDSHLKVMHSRTVNQRAETFESCLRAGDDFIEGGHSMMLRMNIARQGLSLKAPGGGSRGGDGRAAAGMFAAMLGNMGPGMLSMMGGMFGGDDRPGRRHH